MSNQLKHLYEFGRFRLDIMERLFLKDGRPVPLTPKAFEVLGVLVQRSGHLVEKHDLLKEVWADSFVEESNLSRNIYLLRKALGDGQNGHPFIETVPRKGYRFVANVRILEKQDEQSALVIQQSAAAPVVGEDEPAKAVASLPDKSIPAAKSHSLRRHIYGRPTLLLLLLLSGAAAALFYTWKVARPEPANTSDEIKSLAVLPFKSIDAQGGDEQLGLGMADAMIVKLSKLPQVSVLPTTAIFKYSGRERDPMAAGRALGVDAVLDGTIQRSDGRIRVTVQLINVSNGRTLWSNKFDEQLTGIFALQDSVSEQVARTLAPQISGGERQQIAKRITANTAAYESYLMGLYFWNRRTKENIAKAIPYLQQAIEQDPSFAQAYALLADCYFSDAYKEFNLLPAQESFARAEAAATKAFELDESIPEAHSVMAHIRAGIYKDYAGAEREHRRALELNPNFAIGHVRYGYDLFNRFQLTEALREMRRAQELDPLSPGFNAALSFMLVMSRDYDEAIKFGRRAVELNITQTAGRSNLGEAYFHKGMFQEAIATFQDLSKDDPLLAQQELIWVYAGMGRRAEAQTLFARLRQSPDYSRIRPLNMAIIYMALGEKDKAFEQLKKVQWDRFKVALLNYDPQCDALRSDPRVAELLRRQGIKSLGQASSQYPLNTTPSAN